MKTILYKDVVSKLETGSSNKVQGIDASGNPVLTTPNDITAAGGCGRLTAVLAQDKWYRIAVGHIGNRVHSAILNVGNTFNHANPRSVLLYVFSSGYTGQSAAILAKTGYILSGIRLLTNKDNPIFLDIRSGLPNYNELFLAYSCNLNFTFQTPTLVPDEVEEGYNVQLFTDF